MGDFMLDGGTESSKFLFHLRTSHASAIDAFRRAEMIDCGQQVLNPGAPARSPAILENHNFGHVVSNEVPYLREGPILILLPSRFHTPICESGWHLNHI